MCESEPAKQKYLAQAFPYIPLFEDMQELGNGAAKEYRTGNHQEVPKASKKYFKASVCQVGYLRKFAFKECDLCFLDYGVFPSKPSSFATGGHPAHWLSMQVDLSPEQQCQELPG